MPRTLRLVTVNFQRAIHYDRNREHFGTPSVLGQAEIVAAQGAQAPARGPTPPARLAADLPTAGLLGYHRCDRWRR